MNTLHVVKCKLLVVAMATSSISAFSQTDSVVSIYTQTKGGASSQGTGFVVGSTGRVVTAYHVVQDSSQIEIVDSRKRIHKNVKILSLNNRRDIAVLAADTLSDVAGLTISSSIPDPRSEVRVFGSPRGLPKQVFYGRTTASSGNGLVDSTTLSSSSGRSIFAETIKIAPVDVTVYGGLSGAPLTDDAGRVFGVLSGSYDEGRGIAWAIPYFYILEALNSTEAPKEPNSINNWPRLTLMSDTWLSLKRSYPAKLSSEEMKSLEILAGLYSRLTTSLWRAAESTSYDVVYDDSTLGRCRRKSVQASTVQFKNFDHKKQLIRGEMSANIEISADHSGGYLGDQAGSWRRGCNKQVLADEDMLSARTVMKADVLVTAEGDDDKPKVIMNVTDCSLNNSECRSNSFGNKRGRPPEFVNERIMKWQGLLYRRVD